MKGWDRSNSSVPKEGLDNNNANMFQNDFNINSGLQDNYATLKSNASIPDAWRALLNLNQLSVNSSQMLQDGWANQSTTSSLASFMRTLSVQQTNSNQFQRLPAEWAQHMQNLQQNPSPQPQQQVEASQFQKLTSTALQQIPYSGEKRSSEEASLTQQTQQKQPKLVPDANRISPVNNTTGSSQHLHVLADVKLEKDGNSGVDNKAAPVGNTRWNSWSHEEEVFLVVAVLDRFFRRGSLASSGKGAGNQGDCWQEIQQLYDRICRTWASQSENRVKPPLINRSSSALCRHFKIMKVRAVEGDKNGSKNGNFRKYLREWDTIYNINGKLIPELY